MADNKYITLNIKKDTAERLKKMKIAGAYTSGHISSYSELIDDLIENVRKYNPAMYEVFRNLKQSTNNER